MSLFILHKFNFFYLLVLKLTICDPVFIEININPARGDVNEKRKEKSEKRKDIRMTIFEFMSDISRMCAIP